ncbi:MAG: hypothetical protein IID46_02730 [Planctomycetes bacterium]|nr:hypothetical protein [Planctomycetota bacterium]
MKTAPAIVLTILLCATGFAAEPNKSDPATEVAKKRAEKLRVNVKDFRLHLSYHGESGKPYYHLMLSVPPIEAKKTTPFSRLEQISEKQAVRIIDHLAEEGFLKRAQDADTLRKLPVGPLYLLRVRAGELQLGENLGWDLKMLKHLDGLRKALDGDAEKSMGLLLGRLAGHRREWEAVVAAEKAKKPNVEESITVTILGTLRTGIIAIGGETTGTTITAKGITWELDLGKSAAMRKAAQKFNGKKVIVQGSLERRRGVEIKERWIVTITGLQAVGDAGVGGIVKPAFHATVGRTNGIPN